VQVVNGTGGIMSSESTYLIQVCQIYCVEPPQVLTRFIIKRAGGDQDVQIFDPKDPVQALCSLPHVAVTHRVTAMNHPVQPITRLPGDIDLFLDTPLLSGTPSTPCPSCRDASSMTPTMLFG